MAFNWYTTLPGDSDIVSQHPANERAFRTSVNGAYSIEHDPTEGRHKHPGGSTAQRNAANGTWAEGSFWVNSDDGRFRLQRAASVAAGVPSFWQEVAQEFAAGTKVVFGQASAPAGWAQTADNDRILRVVSGAGGGTGGSWSVSGFAADSHVLTLSEIPAHTHSYTRANISTIGCALSSSSVHNQATGDNTGSAGGGGGHTHTVSNNGAWRPAYLDVIVCTKS